MLLHNIHPYINWNHLGFYCPGSDYLVYSIMSLFRVLAGCGFTGLPQSRLRGPILLFPIFSVVKLVTEGPIILRCKVAH